MVIQGNGMCGRVDIYFYLKNNVLVIFKVIFVSKCIFFQLYDKNVFRFLKLLVLCHLELKLADFFQIFIQVYFV